MSQENSHPLFYTTEEERQEIRRELGLKENVIQEDIDAILEWFEKQPHLIDAGLPDRDFIERILIIAKGSREKTKRKIDNFYKHRSFSPELIQERSKYIGDAQYLWTFYRAFSIPRLYDLKRVTIFQITDPDPNNADIETIMKNAIIFGDIRLKYDYMLGDIWVVDLKNTSIGHVLRANPVVFSKVSQMFMEGIGIKMYAIHIIGAQSVIQFLLEIVKKFVNPKIMDRIKIHRTLEDLHQDLPKKCLPKEYGGDEPSMNFTMDKYRRELKNEKTKHFLDECSKQVSDESKRPGSIFQEDYLSGSFKKLEVD